MSIDGTPISRADVARMEADEALHREWQRKAARVIAASAVDADDCRQLLSMLGLDTAVLIEARKMRPAARSARRPATRPAAAKTAAKTAAKSARRRATAA
jgi:hypothetical protein